MRRQIRILGIPIDSISRQKAMEKLKLFLDSPSIHTVFTPNPEIVMLAQEDMGLKRAIEDADLVLPDGIGLIIASKLKGLGLKERITGIDTMATLLDYCGKKEKSIFILGGKPGRAEKACQNIEVKYPGIKIAGFKHGYYQEDEEAELLNYINSKGADILFVCLGAPKQEKWIHQHRDKLNCRLAMGVGGSVDIYSGQVKRAPKVFQKLGLEWFYRLIKEPWRIGRMLLLPKFLIQVIIRE